jgi:hypothetical protein
MKYYSRLSGHAKFWHPKAPAKEVESSLGMKAKISHSVGEERNRGDHSKYKETYCFFDLANPKKYAVEDILELCLEKLEQRDTHIGDLIKTGGKLDIGTQLLDDKTIQLYLERELICRVLKIGASLMFEMCFPVT